MQPVHSQAEADIATERGRFKRLIIAWQDLDEARESLGRLLGQNGKSPPTASESDIRQALLTSVVVAYGRLLRRTRVSASVPGHLPDRFAVDLTDAQRVVHTHLLQLRDQEFAHSDASVADVKVSVSAQFGGFLLPESRQLRRHSLSDGDLRTLSEILEQVHRYLYDEMLRLYPVLAPHGDF